jgi:hypothetical protein
MAIAQQLTTGHAPLPSAAAVSHWQYHACVTLAVSRLCHTGSITPVPHWQYHACAMLQARQCRQQLAPGPHL